MDRRPARPIAFALAAALSLAAVAFAKGKDAPSKPDPDAPKTGTFNLLDAYGYTRMGVPKDYDDSKYYPLLLVLSPGAQKQDPWADAWSEALMPRGWIVAAPSVEGPWKDEGSIGPIKASLARAKSVYKIDERRVVIAGHIAGAQMAWRMAVTDPDLWAGVVSLNGGPSGADQNALKKIPGKPVFLFTGAKDTFYTPEQLETDKSGLEFAKLKVTVDVREGWKNDFSHETVSKVAQWLEGIWPPGAYREKAKALEAAIAAKDFQAAQAAYKDLQAELKKSPYPAFEERAAALYSKLLETARALLAEAKGLVAENKPLLALERAEAAAKGLKGLKAVEAEAVSTLAALRKDPAVVAALAQKKAEDQSSSYMEKAVAAETKGDPSKALEWYRKVVALGETSRKAEAAAKVAELEAKAGGGAAK